MVVCFWGVKQLDNTTFDNFDEPDTIQLLDNSISESTKKDKDEDEKPAPEKFDMKELDNAIIEIESFISELDKKL